MNAAVHLVEVRVPDMGNFKDVAVIDVLVKPGESIEPEAPLVTLETEKATMDVPSTASGVIEKVHVAKGGTVSPGDLIVTVRAAAADRRECGGERFSQRGISFRTVRIGWTICVRRGAKAPAAAAPPAATPPPAATKSTAAPASGPAATPASTGATLPAKAASTAPAATKAGLPPINEPGFSRRPCGAVRS